MAAILGLLRMPEKPREMTTKERVKLAKDILRAYDNNQKKIHRAV